MRAFTCRVCDSALYFENSVCVTCGSQLGFSRAERAIVPLSADDGTYTDASGLRWTRCANLGLSGCTWLTEDPEGLCFSCSLTRIRPNDADLAGLSAFGIAEQAKRRLIVELDDLGLPIIPRQADPENGLAFDLLSSTNEEVTIGHADGVITIDLAEGNDAYRERLREQLDEPYRTMLGHFRHEIGHYYEPILIDDDELRARYRELFGDERADYQAEIDRHYAQGPPEDWPERYISAYATMHPFEDFAETFAHVLHITDSVDTASAYGLVTVDPSAFTVFRDLVTGVWIPLSTALNQINQSMGKEPLYPFVLAPGVLDKLEFVASLIGRQRAIAAG
ncbi:putative zinc-binding metallopeptidase [Aeromicrobium sp. YIM 150415]|uniref:zinc-binding metallopeptidase family protein n=1 Tax=Aeromicrobium sp. YIM 150415 TaxID=2803912 RepID=UPI0019661345|nr:putative zinc-binding metallopeptidase [Aeromicrobium sp. YIM 150415]MBM9462754.1 putative zinc-binding metallopeptidase [Aeromicrobium sp. YIM 150415]